MKNYAFSASALAFAMFLSGCVQPPQSPMEAHARRAAGAELAATQCGAYVGGYEAAKELKADANRNLVSAQQMGATPAVLKKAKTDVETGFNTMAAFSNKQEACNTMVSQLAWTNT